MTFKGVNLETVEVHPLFTVDEDSDDDEIKTVTSIHVARKENGKLMFAPRMRTAGELTSLEQIAQEFGGGEYVLIGYNNGRISARKTICLPGRSKPMFDEGIEPTVTPVQAPAPQIADPMQAMMGVQGGGSLMGLIMMMMQQMMQQQAAAAQSQTQMFIAMMQGNQQSSAEEKAQARAELQANIERERINSERTMALMREMMGSKGGGSGEDFTRGVEFMRSFATQQIETLRANAKGEDSDWGSILETLGQVMQGVGMLKSVGGGLPEGAPGISEVAEAAQ
jgi:hypothetical protein